MKWPLVAKLLIVGFLIGGVTWITSYRNAPKATQQLLQLRGYEAEQRGFFSAVAARDIPAINAFLDSGMDPNLKNPADGRTALITAAAQGSLEVVQVLLRRHADLNVKDKSGYTALFHAIEARYDEVSNVLLAQPGLDLNARGKNGITALASYVWRRNQEAVTDLVKRGADVNLADDDGDTALHGAAQTGDVEIIQMLLEKGADPNCRNSIGGTPLMWAAVYNNEEAVKVLLKAGADPGIKDNDGKTAANWAVQNEHQDLAQFLQSAKRTTKD